MWGKYMRAIFLLPFILIVSFFTSACQTSMLKQFEQVNMGMEKGQVLELMGSPKDVQRFHGKDRWKYVFYEDEIRFTKEFHFFEGSVVYIGDIWEPPYELSAVVADKKKDELEISLQKQAQQDDAAFKQANSYEEYQSKTKSQEKVRYFPVFEAIQ